VEQALAGPSIGWRAAELALFRSQPGRGPARYVIEARIPLG
jgi:hypothetical protein